VTWLRESGLDGALLAAVFALAALGAGALAWRGRDNDPRAILERFAVGFGLFGLLTLLAGALGVFRPPLIFVLLVFVIGLIHLRKNRAALTTLVPRGAFEYVAVAIILFLFVSTFLAALGPELEPDALSYHLPAAVDWAQTGHDPYSPHNYPTGYPLLVEGVYAWLVLAGRPEAARVLHCFAMLLATLATALLGARVAGRRAGVLAATILAGVPMLAWTAQTANTEGFGLLFFVLAILRLDDHLREGKRGDLVWSAVFLGLCASTKIWNLLFVPLFAAVVFAFWLRLARQKKARLSASWRNAFLFGAAALAVYLPWAVRGFVFTGDPLYPMLVPLWSRWQRYFFDGISHYVAETYGAGHGFAHLLLVGWNLTFLPERFGHLAIGWLLLPLATFGLVRLRRRPLLALLTPIAGVALLVWFATSQQVRYLAPLFPYAAVLAAAPVLAAAEKRAWRWLPLAVALLALTGWAPIVRHQWSDAGFAPKVYTSLLTGRATRDQIRERHAYNDEWSLWRFANSALPDKAKIVGDGAQARLWAKRPFADLNYDPDSYFLYVLRDRINTPGLNTLPTHLVLNAGWENRYGDAEGERWCRIYTNGALVVLERRPNAVDCAPPALSPAEPFRWLDVASPRDPHGYWWIGARARIMLARGTRLEIIAPFSALGVTKLSAKIGEQDASEFEIRERQIIVLDARPDEIIELIAPRTVDPIALGYGGDPAPKAFLVRILP